MTTKNTSFQKNLRIAQVLLVITALSALLAGVGALFEIDSANKGTLVVEIWRTVGLFTFAALFSVLAYKPSVNRPLWIIVIANKCALTIAGIFLMGQEVDVAGASDILIFDGGLTVVLLAASFFANVWKK